MSNIAIVIPWFGKDLKGGAEQLAWQVATRLAIRKHHVEILTTCCRNFISDWGTNHYSPGKTKHDGVQIRRFPVNPRNKKAFDETNHHLLEISNDSLRPGVCPSSIDKTKIFTEENINSTALLEYLKSSSERYEAFLFIPYLYGPILNGLPFVAEKAFFQPCLHDEVYAYLPMVEKNIRRCKALLFNSHGEMQLALNLFGPGIFRKSFVIGTGVEINCQSNVKFKTLPRGIKKQEYLLYAGRRDPTKNLNQLKDTFRTFKSQCESDLKLVLVGPGVGNNSDKSCGIIDLKLVAEDLKESLMRSCLALVNPSRNESYSRVIMEAWLCGNPVIANSQCMATAIAVESAQGGWIAGSDEEWVTLFSQIQQLPSKEIALKGNNGKQYAQKYADWDSVIDGYERIFSGVKNQTRQNNSNSYVGMAIHQVLPNLSYGDAISNHALKIRDFLRKRGATSNIYVQYIDKKLINECQCFHLKKIKPSDTVLYHHSIGSELTPHVVRHPGPKCLIYHNVTPASFFRKYQPGFAEMLDKGREELSQLSSGFEHSMGDSQYNCDELKEKGFNTPGVLPIIIDPDSWNSTPEPDLMARLQDGKKNIIFIGRIAPNKCQNDLVEGFAWLCRLMPDVRLFLIGCFDDSDPYYQEVQGLINKFQLHDSVTITGKIDDAQLQAYFMMAHLYWSMRKHEGFGVPLIESMWFNIPVFAYKSTAVPETLGHAAFMFTDKSSMPGLAATAKLLLTDKVLKEKIINAQIKRRNEMLPESIYKRLEDMICRL